MAATPTLPSAVTHTHPPRTGRLLIDGDWVDADSGETFDVHDPATGEVIARCASGAQADVDRAVRAARRARSCSSPPSRRR